MFITNRSGFTPSPPFWEPLEEQAGLVEFGPLELGLAGKQFAQGLLAKVAWEKRLILRQF